MAPNTRLVVLLGFASLSFVVLLFLFFFRVEDSMDAPAPGDSALPKMRRIPLKPAPPLSAPSFGDQTEAFFANREVKCPAGKLFAPADLAAHNTEGDLWVLIHGYVLNVTRFVHHHPGGVQMLMKGGGGERDAAEQFASFHPPSTVGLFSDFCIGKLEPTKK